MTKTFKQLREKAMADPKRRAAIEREEKELRQRVSRHLEESVEVLDRPRKS